MSSDKVNRKIIVLCGSSRFKEEHEQAQAELGLQGHVVIPMSTYGHRTGMDMAGPVKAALDELHLDKIRLGTSIYVVNVRSWVCDRCGAYVCRQSETLPAQGCCEGYGFRVVPYVGNSTRREIRFARDRVKEILWLNAPTEEMLQDRLYKVHTNEKRLYHLVYAVRAPSSVAAEELVLRAGDGDPPEPGEEDLLECIEEVVVRVEEVVEF